MALVTEATTMFSITAILDSMYRRQAPPSSDTIKQAVEVKWVYPEFVMVEGMWIVLVLPTEAT
jgi:hypothetical protein